jgi:hypothetical protein
MQAMRVTLGTSGGESWNSRSSRKTWDLLFDFLGRLWSSLILSVAFVRILTFTSSFLNQKESTPTTDRAVET